VTDAVPYDPAKTSVIAVAGAHNMAGMGVEEIRKVSQILKHPDFIPAKFSNLNDDIALIKLETPIKFSDIIRPICLPTQDEAIPTTKVCAISGWGRISSTEQSQVLKQLLVQVHDAKTCRADWTTKPTQYVESKMICAGDLSGKEGSCQGDSGGMLACQQAGGGWTLYGATSFGDSTCSQKKQTWCVDPRKQLRELDHDQCG